MAPAIWTGFVRNTSAGGEHGIRDARGINCWTSIVYTNDRCSVQDGRNQRRDAGDFACLDRGPVATL